VHVDLTTGDVYEYEESQALPAEVAAVVRHRIEGWMSESTHGLLTASAWEHYSELRGLVVSVAPQDLPGMKPDWMPLEGYSRAIQHEMASLVREELKLQENS
jgi:hypothetical protein